MMPSRPRVLVLANGLRPPLLEAGARNVAELLARLRERYELSVLGLAGEDGEAELAGCRVHRVRSPGYHSRWARNLYPLGAARLLRRAPAVFRRERPDLVLCAMETASTGLLARAIRRAAGSRAPIALWFWSDVWDAGFGGRHWLSEGLPHALLNGRRLAARALRSVDVVLASSRHLERTARALGARRVHFAPAGVDVSRFRPPAAARNGTSPLGLAYVGHLTWTKGTSVLAEAVEPLLRDGRAELTFAASSVEAEESEVLARLRALPRVRLLGACDPAEVFGAADLTVLPRRHSYGTASHPGVVLESLACGTPVATSRLPAAEELVEDGRNGFLLPPGDATALRGLLEALAADPARVRGLRAAARASVEPLSWDAAASRFGGALDEVLACR